jgi:hypothetical protein
MKTKAQKPIGTLGQKTQAIEHNLIVLFLNNRKERVK